MESGTIVSKAQRFARKRLAEQMGLPNCDQWHSHAFRQLREAMFRCPDIHESNVPSEITLKRFCGRVPVVSEPNHTTKKAIAQFLGFPSWDALETEAWKIPDGNFEAEGVLPKGRFNQLWNVYKRHALFTLCTALAMLLFWALMPAKPSATLLLLTENPVSPQTVEFQYNLSKPVDELRLDLDLVSYESGEAVRLSRPLSSTSGVERAGYYRPGLYCARLISATDTLASCTFFVATAGWLCLARSKRDGLPEVLEENDLIEDQLLAAPHGTSEWSHLLFAPKKPFVSQNSDWMLKAKVRNNKSTGGVPAFDMRLGLKDVRGATYNACFLARGFSDYAYVTVNGQQLKGTETPLGALEMDSEARKDWQWLALGMKGNIFSVYHNELLVFRREAVAASDSLQMLEVLFRGRGEADSVMLLTGNDTLFVDGFVRL